MKKFIFAAMVCLVVSSTAVFAQAGGRRFAEPTMLDLKVDATRLFRQANGPHANVATENPANAFIFAVVGSTAGSGGTFFRSEVTLVNNDPTFAQNVAAFYFPAGGGSCNGGLTKTIRLDANTFYVWSDFVNQVFNTSGLGSVVILGVDGAGNFDSTANIDGFSRIWTPVAGFQGTASQSFPGVALSGYPGTQWIYGLRNDSSFRTNLFIFNYLPTGSTATRTFRADVIGMSGTGTVGMSVPACSVAVASLGGTNYGPLIISVTPPDSAGGWFAFGSTVDNLSGDNWSVSGRPDRR